MGNQRTSGLTKRGGLWHIDKRYRGTRICESTGTGDLREAEEILAERLSSLRKEKLFGVRQDRTFRAAATKYLEDFRDKRSIKDDALQLKILEPFIGKLTLRNIHMGTLQEFIAHRRGQGVKTKTVNAALAVVRRIVNLAASEWMDGGMTWLENAPKIRLFPVTDSRSPYPLTDEEQAVLFQELPKHLALMALFKVNTGCREQEVCGLRWDYEVPVPELGTSVFIIPGDRVKNGEERVVVLNRVAKSVIDSLRGQHKTHVFVRAFEKKGRATPVTSMNNTAWKSARERAAEKWAAERNEAAPEGFRRVRVHDLKHTYGARLRSAGVTFEDRQDLLGHRSGRITTHYSRPELTKLIEAAERVCSTESRKTPATTWLRRKHG
jgi:integrase